MDDWGTNVTLTNLRIRLMQWIDDAANIADDDDIVFVMDGVTITAKIQLTANAVNNVCVWQMGPFDPPLRCNTFVGDTLDNGAFVIWLA
jgi:hypothetical protein